MSSKKVERKKVLLMGKSGAGKTSMRSIIFASYVADDVYRLGMTMDIEHAHVRMLGNLVVNLWDCGGQDSFMDSYFMFQKEQIFKGCEVLIYVIDVKSERPEADLQGYRDCLAAIADYSAGAKIFVLVHKMDLLLDSEKNAVFEAKKKELEEIAHTNRLTVDIAKTSIWDKTLYSAWSKIVTQLIPKKEKFQTELQNLAEQSGANEVLLFEKATMLNICYIKNDANGHKTEDDEDLIAERMEGLSHYLKNFKLICWRKATNFESLEIRTSTFSAIMQIFTDYTCIMLVSFNPDIPMWNWRKAIDRIRPKFQKLDQKNRRAQQY